MHKITYLGDSITFGQYVDPSLRWTSLIDKRLPPGWTSRNEGVNGETTRLALERFPKAVQADPPDILTIQYGLNDCNCWLTDRGLPRVSLKSFTANITEMVCRARGFGVRTICLIDNHPTLKGETYASNLVNYVAEIHHIANLESVQLCQTFVGILGARLGNLSSMLLPDGLHLSPAGHQLYADTIWPVMERCIKEIES